MALQEFCESRPELLESPTIQLVRKVHLCHIFFMRPGVSTLPRHLKWHQMCWKSTERPKTRTLMSTQHLDVFYTITVCKNSSTTPLYLVSLEVRRPPWLEYLSWQGIALGALTQLVWARALGLPIERPKCTWILSLQGSDIDQFLALSLDGLEGIVKAAQK